MSTATQVGNETLTMVQAINRALDDAMTEDLTVLMFGEDVGQLGGVFRVTDGLHAKFGDDRCFDTPLAESGIVGFAVGLAMNGMRPVIEMQFDAFAYPAFEQIVSHVAKMRNRTRGHVEMPIVIRIPYGGGIGGVEHHSDSSESYYAHTPGLTVVAPSTPQDAYTMLREAIASPDPVVFMEPKKLYWEKGDVDFAMPEPGAMAKAVVRREGRDVTIVTYGQSVPVVMQAADIAEGEGRSIQVVDIRSLQPFDADTVMDAVRSTGRAVVVAEAPGFASVASEVAAQISEKCFHYLHAPVRRVTGFDIPFPPPHLEHFTLPSADRILETVDELQWEEA